MAKGRTQEELAQVVIDYMAKCHEPPTRNKIKLATGIGNVKLNELEELGLVKLPDKIKPGMNSPTWRFYKT
jgi:hypothetical protein